MKILIINGSHRMGNTKYFVEEASQILSQKGHEIESLDLLDKRFEICDGCLICEETGKCVIKDTFTKEICPVLKSADAYVFATPVYFNTVTTLFKNFIDRTNCLCEYFESNSKKVAFFLVGQADEESLNSALHYLNEYAEIMNFDVIKDNICVLARDVGELKVDETLKTIVSNWF